VPCAARGQPAGETGGQRRHGAVVDREREPAGGFGGNGAGKRGADLGEPGVRSADRQRAACGGLGGDHPERLGERARHDHRLACALGGKLRQDHPNIRLQPRHA